MNVDILRVRTWFFDGKPFHQPLDEVVTCNTQAAYCSSVLAVMAAYAYSTTQVPLALTHERWRDRGEKLFLAAHGHPALRVLHLPHQPLHLRHHTRLLSFCLSSTMKNSSNPIHFLNFTLSKTQGLWTRGSFSFCCWLVEASIAIEVALCAVGRSSGDIDGGGGWGAGPETGLPELHGALAPSHHSSHPRAPTETPIIISRYNFYIHIYEPK